MTRLLPILCAVALLACCFTACTRNPDVMIVNAEIRTEFRHTNGIAGQWDHDRRTIYLGAMVNGWTWAHECAHAADSLGLPYAQVLAMAGTLPPHLAHQQDLARRVAKDAAKIRHPLAHWIALGRICGPQSVAHSEIINQIREML